MPASEGYLVLEVAGPSETLERSIPLIFEAGCLGTEEAAPGRERCYFPADRDVKAVAEALRRAFPELSVGSVQFFPENDWLALWRRGLEGFPIGERFYVLPTWKEAPATSRIVLRIDPERAFGTGTHETTRLCLELLEKYAKYGQDARPGAGAVDAGTGTGVLAMVAAHMGWSPVVAVERDPDAVACARANVARNGLADRIRVVPVAIAEAEIEPADLVVANLSAPVLQEELPRLRGWLAPGGVLILSGLLQEEAEEIARRAGLQLLERRSAGEWVALVLTTW